MKARSLFASFRFAMQGLVHALGSHPHMRHLLIISALLLLLSQLLGVGTVGLMTLVFGIGIVMIVELVNVSLEATVDLACDSYHPLAKVAKDVAGAAVMIAITLLVFICALVFLESPRVTYFLGLSAAQPSPKPLHVALVGAALIAIFVVLGKVWGKKGTLWRGGAISGHAALAGYFVTTISYKAGSPLIFGLALGLAFLVAQSRLEAGIHTLREVLLGAMVGLGVSAVMLSFLAGSP
ncbi:MAG: phosphatase PAP2 family protein [Armatimonadetes bacterium]|nr:phosphatase PAP2 family protein [Armatimonadota bacterium]NIM23400.1 phosphatase PAP2 family protein [Armatimonadota bacterium]NIM67265.1 phosphatase PAP2 family protein [Armatimonadota bacterium]NIM75763.1 phosphatase PAP2 family protein [Armatimonadota bacterium]NIN05451.1 phosphatase PAP2 family protein [Armatimonadota bacterium]